MDTEISSFGEMRYHPLNELLESDLIYLAKNTKLLQAEILARLGKSIADLIDNTDL